MGSQRVGHDFHLSFHTLRSDLNILHWRGHSSSIKKGGEKDETAKHPQSPPSGKAFSLRRVSDPFPGETSLGKME